MASSLRAMAACNGHNPGTFSVLGDFFGFRRGRLPDDPAGAAVTVSLLRQFQRLQGDHFNLNVIIVGTENFTDGDLETVDYAIFKLRNIYNQRAIGVGRVLNWNIPLADADGLDAPTSRGQLEELTDDWEVPNNGIDLFIPHDMNIPSGTGILLGRSAVDGPCPPDKDQKGMDGSVSGLWGDDQTARTVAHELGHYLTLEHRNSSPANLMCQSGSASSIRDSTDIDAGQAGDVIGHCMTRGGCAGGVA